MRDKLLHGAGTIMGWLIVCAMLAATVAMFIAALQMIKAALGG